MKKKYIIYAIVLLSLLSVGIVYAAQYENRVIPNSEGNNATSTVSILRYLDNGTATSTLIASVKDTQEISLAIKVTASTTATVRFTIDYGISVPVPGFIGRETMEWFERRVFVSGRDLGYDNSTSTPINTSISVFGTTTPYYWLPIPTTATTSVIISLPTLRADQIRINASIVGSAGALWMSPIHKVIK